MIKVLIVISLIFTVGAGFSQVNPKVKIQIFDNDTMNSLLVSNNQAFIYFDTIHSYRFDFKYLDYEINPKNVFYSIWVFSHGFITDYRINTEIEVNKALKSLYKRLGKPYDLYISVDSIFVNGTMIRKPEVKDEKYFMIVSRTNKVFYFNSFNDFNRSHLNYKNKDEIFTNNKKPVFVLKYKRKTAPKN